MTYYNNILACTAEELLTICTKSTYDKLVQRGKINRLRRACKGTPALIEFRSLPAEYRDALIEQYGDPDEAAKWQSVADMVTADMAAIKFYTDFRLADSNELPKKNQRLYSNEASIFNAFEILMKKTLKHQSSGATLTGFWTMCSNALEGLQLEWPHKLPKTEKRLREKYEKYKEQGYRALISEKFGNQNTRIVNEHLESLLLNIYMQTWKPNYKKVHAGYMEFLHGEKGIVNKETGEIYDRNNYEPISESTVRNYMTKWSNAVGTHKKRSGSRIGYNSKYRSYADTVTDYAGTIISMDDRDLPWKMHNGKRPVAYLTLDVASKCFIGWAFAKPKTREDDNVNGKGMRLVMDCFRNTFDQLEYYGVNMPAEVEVENHLMSTLTETTLKEGNLFRFVRFAAAENPQEKEIERAFRILRYDYDKLQNNGAGWQARPFAKDESNQKGLRDDVKYTFEEICEMAENSINEYNDAPHPNQKEYPGMSRLDVFLTNQHPQLLPINWRDVSRWVGHSVTTSVNRGQVLANNQRFLLEDVAMMDKTGQGRELKAYWFNHNQNRNTIYLYDGEEYLGEARTKPRFHKGRLEQTAEDFQQMREMQAYTASIDNQAKETISKLEPVTFIDIQAVEKATERARKVQIVETPDEEFDYKTARRNAGTNAHNLLNAL